ncbi:MAG: hypothetical protein GX237_04465, partial [Clostridiales bacterium]|nr:hypothetical protein [Clostridiales bacterium]
MKSVNALGGITEFIYDKEDRVVSIIRHASSGNEILSYEYDALGRVILATDGEGNQVKINYDMSGNVSSMVDAMGVTISEIIYDKMGNPIEMKDALGNITLNSYDGMG